MSKWTPGKWIAECVGSGGSYDNPVDLYEVVAENGPRVAEAVSERDARLIAAAPEMAEVIKQLLDDHLGCGVFTSAAATARALLARIEGD